jgi:hypothetical protein
MLAPRGPLSSRRSEETTEKPSQAEKKFFSRGESARIAAFPDCGNFSSVDRAEDSGARFWPMPDSETPIPQPGLWDILDEKVVKELAARAPNDPDRQSRSEALAFFAKTLIEAANQEEFFQDKARRFVGAAIPSERRARAGALASAFGASPRRLIDYLKLKGVM